ncbi:MAG: hypothetical protein AAFR14_03415 [Bacteroidota bacterium]
MNASEHISKFLRQGHTTEERFELEKHALEDDFLADAWEGVQHNSSSDDVISVLERRLESLIKSESRPTRIIALKRYFPIAAAASVVAFTLGAFFFRGVQPESLPAEAQTLAIDLADDIAPRISLDSDYVSETVEMVMDSGGEPSPNAQAVQVKQSPNPDGANISSREIAVETSQESDVSISPQSVPEPQVAEIAIAQNVTENTPPLSNPENENMAIAYNQQVESSNQRSLLGSKLAKRQPIVVQEDVAAPVSVDIDKQAVAQRRATPSPSKARSLTISPDMGWEAFTVYLNEESPLTTDELFMRGLRPPCSATAKVVVLPSGSLSSIEITYADPDASLIREAAGALLQGSGTWSVVAEQDIHVIELSIPLRGTK